ncbi:MAG: hypothetical protein JO257_07365 [Deltaproteobacteria bacterium]|nr:hypothetical protein [Deltaproteobacteria bacterium]
MRSWILVALAACSGGGQAVPDSAAGSDNLLRNGDFEYLDGSGWVAEWERFDSNPNGQIVVVDTAHSGAHALQWQIDAAGDGREYWVTQHGLTTQTLRAGHTYALSGWYLCDASGDVALNYIVRGEPGDSPDLSTISQAPVFPAVVGRWAPFRFEVALPGDAAPDSWQVSVHSIKFNGLATRLTVDDVWLVEL